MNFESVNLERNEVNKLLASANADAALLYIYLKSGNPMTGAEEVLHMNASRVSCAGATLRQLGLWNEEKSPRVLVGERPSYSEQDVLSAGESFRSLCEEVQRLLGRPIHSEDRKILLGFVNYLGMPREVISVLISYCREKARQKGKIKPPTLFAIEKEAYAWAERGIDTLEEAAAFIQTENQRNSRLSRLMSQLQIRGRNLTAAEERYANAWLEMGFEDEVIAMAYERTCLNTGGLNWPYMNKILQRWHEAGLHTADQVRGGDRKPETKGANGELGQAERAAIQRLLKEV